MGIEQLVGFGLRIGKKLKKKRKKLWVLLKISDLLTSILYKEY